MGMRVDRSVYTFYFVFHLYIVAYYNCLTADLANLFAIQCELLNVAHKWKGVGMALGLHPDLLDKIKAEQLDSNSCLGEVLSEWLKRMYDTTSHGLPSWKLLVAAVAHPLGGNNRALAERIAKKYNGNCNKQSMHVCEKQWYV